MRFGSVIGSALVLVAHALSPALRERVLARQMRRCAMCDASFSRTVPHEMHHVNHNAQDHDPSNIAALCSNCHAAHHRHDVPFNHTRHLESVRREYAA